jgi:two-component system chemotaxis response regulator CheB
MSAGRPIRVMVVEDSLVVRQLLAHIVSRDPRLVLAAAVESAEEALAEIERVKPDVISMDIRLPGIDGFEATKRIMTEHPTPIVVFADAVEERSLQISLNALRAGALSVVEKPVAVTARGYEAIAETICTQLVIMSEVSVIRRRPIGQLQRPPSTEETAVLEHPSVVAMAASTGGPPALARVLGALPADFPLPILVVQHMGAPFMEGFASWLDGLVALDVRLAEDVTRAEPGHVYVAPGNRHLTLARGGFLRLGDEAPVAGQRPSATLLMESVARVAGGQGVGVLLTGMGEDGARGMVELRRAGGYTITESESTAVVYGMPAAAVRLGGSKAALALDMIAPRLLRLAEQ